MHLSNQFPELFRQENYAVTLVLMDDKDLQDVIGDEILAHSPTEAAYEKEYSLVPIGALGGRREAEPIPEHTAGMGYECYGATSIEASAKIGISKKLKEQSRRFVSNGVVDEKGFAGYLADTFGRSMVLRQRQRWQKLSANMFNLGGIPGGHIFFNHRLRADGLIDVPNIQTIYDGLSLFTLPTAPHPAAADGAVIGVGAMPVGTTVDFAGAIADTGGYFNAFMYPPAYWALKRVLTHFNNNMQFDDNNERFQFRADTLLVSDYDLARWTEILGSHYIEPQQVGEQTNRENIFMVEGFKLTLKSSPFLVARTWAVGKAKGRGIRILDPKQTDEPWAYWRDEDNRVYWASFDKEWGFMISNWRNWCMGSFAVDGITPPNYGAENTWDQIPAGV